MNDMYTGPVGKGSTWLERLWSYCPSCLPPSPPRPASSLWLCFYFCLALLLPRPQGAPGWLEAFSSFFPRNRKEFSWQGTYIPPLPPQASLQSFRALLHHPPLYQQTLLHLPSLTLTQGNAQVTPLVLSQLALESQVQLGSLEPFPSLQTQLQSQTAYSTLSFLGNRPGRSLPLALVLTSKTRTMEIYPTQCGQPGRGRNCPVERA